MNLIFQRLDPREAFRQAKNTSIELTYIGLAIQSALLSYIVFYDIFGSSKPSFFLTLINFLAVFAILDMAKGLLLGQSLGKYWAAFYCFCQSLFYLGVVTSHTIMPRNLAIFALFSSVLTLYMILSRGTKEYLDSRQG